MLRIIYARPSVSFVAALVMLSLVVGAAGCVSRHQKDVEDAKVAYDQCVEDHSQDHPKCVGLLDTYRAAQERYEEAARRAWSCDPTQEECPRKR